MKTKLSIRRNKKGISSLIIAIYIALLTVTLLSAIFIGVEITSSSIISAARTQQDRNQEEIAIHGPNGMRLSGSGGSIVGSLRVNNTGSIAVRIRALYIGQQFICDPSTFQDTNIAPKESKWISLVSGTFNFVGLDDYTLQSDWTVVTERAVNSTEKGEYILFGRPGDDNSPLKHGFKTGPLLILFDFFNWRTGTSIWESGWSIAKGTDSVSWRIYLINIDTRVITFSPNSFFDLVANTNNQGQDQKWFLDTTSNQQMSVAPGKGVFVHFATTVNGQPQAVTLNPGVSCLNFLVITGSFSDSSNFGQTIPFEAVLITDNPSMALSATPQTIPVGLGPSTITATMIDDSGYPIPNQLITFTTNLGLLSVPVAATDNSGDATVTLTAGPTPGTATITASAMGITRTISVIISSAGSTPTPTPTASPTPIPTSTPAPTATPTPTPTPNPVNIILRVTGLPGNTPPSTIVFTIDSTTYTYSTLPRTFSWQPGSTHTITANSPITVGGNQYAWQTWSDGGAISHVYTVPGSAATITADYKKI